MDFSLWRCNGVKNEDSGVRIGLLEEEGMSLGCRSCGLCCFLIDRNLFASMYDRDLDIEAEGGGIKMKTEINFPLCYAFIEIWMV